jgi:hypothetical protein
MTRFTVQCGYSGYYAPIGEIEAPSLQAASALSLSLALARAEGVVAWASPEPVALAARFMPASASSLVHIIMEGGAIHDVVFSGGVCRVLITDYAVEGADPRQCETDAQGRPVLAFRFGPWPPDPDPEIPRAEDAPDAG